MTQYNTLDVELSNPQFNELKSGIKNGTEETFIECIFSMMNIIFLINCY